MANRTLGKIDFTDASRVPDPAGGWFHNGDTVEWLEYFEQAARAAGSLHDVMTDLGGGDRFLSTQTSQLELISGVPYSAQGFFKSRKPVPNLFVLEANMKFTASTGDGGILCLFDADYDTLNY